MPAHSAPRIQLSDPSPPRKNRAAPLLPIIFVIIALICGGAVGWFAASAVESNDDFAFHVAQMKPLLAHDPQYHEQAKRSMNDDMRLVAYQMHCITEEGLDLREVLDAAMPTTEVPPNLKKLTISRLLENHQQAKDYGLLTPENIARLMKGESPMVTLGELAGQRADVEHIVPVNVVSALDNLLVNLEWLPQSLNAAKSDNITDRAYEWATRLNEAGLMDPRDFAAVEKGYREWKSEH